MKVTRIVPVTALTLAATLVAILAPHHDKPATHATNVAAVYPQIHITGTVNVRPTPDTSQTPLGVVSDANEPQRQCWTAGQNVGGVDVWFRIDYSGSSGYISSFYDDSHYATDADITSDYGIPSCTSLDAGPTAASPQPASSSGLPVDDTGGGYYNRSAAVAWAMAHADEIQLSGAECAWFVSQALWAGGQHQTLDWNQTFLHAHGIAPWHWTQPGTQDATVAPELFAYLQQIDPWATVTPITFDSSANNLPQAEDGDVIAYDWDNDGAASDQSGIDHLAIVTGHSQTNSEYPLVSEWGTTDYPGQRAGYSQRGYTFSAKKNTWLINEFPGVHGWLLHFAWPDAN